MSARVETQDASLDCRRIRLVRRAPAAVRRALGSPRTRCRHGQSRRFSTRLRCRSSPRTCAACSRPRATCRRRSAAASSGSTWCRRSSSAALQLLLMRFGDLLARRRKEDRRANRLGTQSLTIRTAGDRRRFADEVGFVCERKAGKLEATFELPGLADNASKRLEIERIEALGEMDVYDIQTESGEYLSNHLRVHNCFILAVDDTMDAILNWYREEGTIFKGGSGAGINLSNIRSSEELPQGRRHRVGSGELHARRRRVGRHDQVGRQDAPRRQDGHPQRRSPRRRGVHLVQGRGGAQGACPPRRRLRHGPRRPGQPLDPVPERQQLGARHRRVHAGRGRRPRLAAQGGQDRRAGQDDEGARPHAPDRAVGVGVRRPGDAVRHDDQPVAHRLQHRPDQRQQPVPRVHAPRQLGVQPREHQPAAVPRRRRPLRRRGLQAHHRGDVHRAGDPRRQRRLPDRADRRDQPHVPPARPRLREPRRAADGAGHALRLRGRAERGRRRSPR